MSKPNLSMKEWMELQGPIDSDEEREEEEHRQRRYNSPEAVEARRRAAEKKVKLDRALEELQSERDASLAKARLRLKEAQEHAKLQETKLINDVYGQYAKAMREGDFAKVYHMVDKVGISVNWEDSYGNTALICAARYGLKVPIEQLIFRGADVNHENQFGSTPLIEACKGGFGRVLNSLLFDPVKKTDMGTAEMRAEANAKNKFGKTAADYANKHGHGKKCVPILNEAIQRQLDDAMTLGFEIDAEDYKLAVTFNESDSSSLKSTKKRLKQQKPSQFSLLLKTFGMENKVAIARMHKLRDDSARKIQGFSRYIKAKNEMAERFRQIVYEANRKRIKEMKKKIWIVKIQRGYRLKLARKRWALHRKRRLAATKINATAKMFVARCYYKRRLETIWALKRIDAAATLIQCCARRMKAQLVLSMKKRRYNSAILIQNFGRLVCAKRRAKIKQWQSNCKETLQKLRKGTRRIYYMLVFEELKKEYLAIHKIQKWARALLFKWSNRIDWNAIRRYRYIASTRIQCSARIFLAKRHFALLKSLRNKHLAGLPSVLEVRRLKASGKNAYRVGHKSKYGYCSKNGCTCEKFRPPDPMKPLICGCGHFITNHVIGYFRDPSESDYYEPGLARRKKQTRTFSAATGVYENFALVLNLKPRDLRKSLASTQAPAPPPRPPHRPHSAKAANLKYKKDVADKKRRAEARKNPYDPQRYVGTIVSSKQKKNPFAEAKRKVKAKIKVENNMKREETLQHHRDVAEKVTGHRISTADMNEILAESEKGSPGKQRSGLAGAILFDIPNVGGNTNDLSSKPVLGTVRKHTRSLIEQVENDIKSTRKRVKKIQKTISELKYEERKCYKQSRSKRKTYEQNTTMLLLKNRIEEDKIQTTHSKLVSAHITSIDKRKGELLTKLNKINAKAHGLPVINSTSNSHIDANNAGHQYPNVDEHARPTVHENLLSKSMSTSEATPKKKFEPIGEQIDISTKRRTKSERKLYKQAAHPLNANVDRKLQKQITIHKYFQKINPKSEMILHTLKGMMKSIVKGHSRTKHRWQRTPESPIRSVRRISYDKSAKDMNEVSLSRIFDPRDREIRDSLEPFHGTTNKNHTLWTYQNDQFDTVDDRDFTFDQRAETPLEHIAWRQSHKQRKPVVELRLLRKSSQPLISSVIQIFPDKIELKAGRTIVGRDGNACEIMLDSARQPKMISKMHACFWVTKVGHKWRVEVSDCNSTNGTYVNGRKISAKEGRIHVKVGSTVMFGRQSRKERKRSELIYLLADDCSNEIQKGSNESSGVEKDRTKHSTDTYTTNGYLPNHHGSFATSSLKFGLHHMQETMNIMEILSPDRYFD